MSSHLPPIPKANRSPHNKSGAPLQAGEIDPHEAHPEVNPEQKGQQANTRINTTHQGNQQNR